MNYHAFYPILFIIPIYTSSLEADVLFEENFNAQPDYTSDHSEPLNYQVGFSPIPNNVGQNSVIPDNWCSVRQSSSWGNESLEILGSNSTKAKGATGKSLVVHRESQDLGKGTWQSEGLLMKCLPKGQDELYVSYWIKFSPNWTKIDGWTTKMFRIFSWGKEDPITKFFGGGGSGPIALWDYQVNAYGLRNRWSFRGGPHGENYGMSDISGFPRVLSGSGDASLNYTDHTIGQGINGTTPKIPDLVNGGFISDNLNQNVKHDQIYGQNGTWTKIAFYVKMNSAPGVADGKMKQWLNDVLILQSDKIPWTGSTSSPMPKWNVIGFGGNSYFAPYPDADKHEEWYTVDDIYIANSIPGALAPPKPPIPSP